MNFALSPDHQHKLRQKQRDDSGKSNNQGNQTLRAPTLRQFELQGEHYVMGWGG
jgi:hypothetical protein